MKYIVSINDDGTFQIEERKGRIACRVSGQYLQPHEISLYRSTDEDCANYGTSFKVLKTTNEEARAWRASETRRISNTPEFIQASREAYAQGMGESEINELRTKRITVDALIQRLLALKAKDASATVVVDINDEISLYGAFDDEAAFIANVDGHNVYRLNSN